MDNTNDKGNLTTHWSKPSPAWINSRVFASHNSTLIMLNRSHQRQAINNAFTLSSTFCCRNLQLLLLTKSAEAIRSRPHMFVLDNKTIQYICRIFPLASQSVVLPKNSHVRTLNCWVAPFIKSSADKWLFQDCFQTFHHHRKRHGLISLNIIKSWVSTCLVRSHNPGNAKFSYVRKRRYRSDWTNVATSGVHSHFNSQFNSNCMVNQTGKYGHAAPAMVLSFPSLVAIVLLSSTRSHPVPFPPHPWVFSTHPETMSFSLAVLLGGDSMSIHPHYTPLKRVHSDRWEEVIPQANNYSWQCQAQ